MAKIALIAPHPDCIRDEGQDNRDNYNRYRRENYKKELERTRKNHARNRDKRNKYSAEWYQRSKEYRREYMREYWKKRKEGEVSG